MNEWTDKDCNRKNIVRMNRETLKAAHKLIEEAEEAQDWNLVGKAKHRIAEMIKAMDRIERVNGRIKT